jgi:hypothetical protein
LDKQQLLRPLTANQTKRVAHIAFPRVLAHVTLGAVEVHDGQAEHRAGGYQAAVAQVRVRGAKGVGADDEAVRREVTKDGRLLSAALTMGSIAASASR